MSTAESVSYYKNKLMVFLNYMNLCQIFLALVSLGGLIGCGVGYYSGTRLDGFTDDNWVYVVILFLGIFSFVSGIVGFYGVKHRSKEYLKTVLFILFPLCCMYFIFMIAFFSSLTQIRDEKILTPTAARVISVFNVVDFMIKATAIVLLMCSIKILRDSELESISLSKALNSKNGYKGTVESFKDPRNEEMESLSKTLDVKVNIQ